MGAARPRLSWEKGGVAFFLTLGFCACAGPSQHLKKTINANIAAGDFQAARKEIESNKTVSYGRKNRVLYYLDLGAVQHDAGDFKGSDLSLEKAERRMDELYTKSVTRSVGMLILNDNTVEYAGERFERAMLNVYRALNYAFRSNLDEALVETRKLSRLLQEYADLYGESKTAYRDDAFAQFLASLLYEDDGRGDDARIAWDKSRKAYERYSTSYGLAIPKLLPIGEKAHAGEVVFLHYNGVAPRKIAKSFAVAWSEAQIALNAHAAETEDSQAAQNAILAGFLGSAIVVSYPEYIQDPQAIENSMIESDGHKAITEIAQDISAIAQKDLEERMAFIRTRAIARAAVKFVLAKTAANAAEKKYGHNSWQHLLALASGAAIGAATEIPDTRAWTTLPRHIRVARLRLPEGPHDISVTYSDANGKTLSTRVFKNVMIHAGRRIYIHDRTAQ